MVMKQGFVREFLQNIGGDEWPWRVLDAACGQGKDINCYCGFSEYYSMASWMINRHPEAVTVIPKNFTRLYPVQNQCCPTEDSLQKNHGVLFVGLESNHCEEAGSATPQNN